MDADGNSRKEPASNARQTHWWGTSSLNLAARQPVSHAIMFYLLSAVAMILFAPCVLVPIWQDVQKLQADEQAVGGVIRELRQQVERNNTRIQALEADPLVIDRVARRELNQRPSNELHVRWTAAELAALRLNLPHDLQQGSSSEPPPIVSPPWVDSLSRWLPAWATSDLFAKSPHRQMLLVMAGSLLLTAFVLYTPRAETRVREPAAEETATG
jgi:cell division protein FtsB